MFKLRTCVRDLGCPSLCELEQKIKSILVHVANLTACWCLRL